MTDTQEALLAGIIEAPEDDARRLIYADYLEENDDEPRADYIRQSVELDRMEREFSPAYILYQTFSSGDNIALDQINWEPVEPSVQRFKTLRSNLDKAWGENGSAWVREAKLDTLGVSWLGGKRGFPEWCSISGPVKVTKCASDICSRTPLSSVTFSNKVSGHHLRAIVESGLLDRIQTIRNFREGANLLLYLLDTPATKTLQYCNDLPNEELATLIDSPQFTSIRKLNLSDHTIDEETAERLIAAPHLKSVQELRFGENSITSEHLAEFARQDWSNLQHLELNDCDLDDDDIKVLASCPTLTNLHTLYLDDNEITGEGLGAILASKSLQNLRVLSIDSNSVSSIPKKACANTKIRLWTLSASYNQFLQGDLKTLAESELFSELVWLSLGSASITDNGLKNLIKAPFHRLAVANLMHNRFQSSGVKSFAVCEQFKNLQRCHLVNNEIDDEAAKALAESPILKGIKHLCVSCAGLSGPVQKSLEQHYGDAISLL